MDVRIARRVGLLAPMVVFAFVNGQRVRAFFGSGQLLRKVMGEGDLFPQFQFDGQGKFYLTIQPPICAFIQVGGFPILARVSRRKFRHVPVFGMGDFFRALFVFSFALDVVGFRGGRLSAASAADGYAQVIDCHFPFIDFAPQAWGCRGRRPLPHVSF